MSGSARALVLGLMVGVLAAASQSFCVRDAAAQTTELISVSSGGEAGNGNSGAGAVSADGRFVVFSSDATNLVPGDNNDVSDVFLRDRRTGETTRISVGPNGEDADAESFGPAISADGSTIGFVSNATNLVSGNKNGTYDVFVYDRLSSVIERVSVSPPGGDADGPSFLGSVGGFSTDGRFVVFSSWATNLVAHDTNDWMDVFVRDRQTGVTERVSVSDNGEQTDLDNAGGAINGDGRYIAFVSAASNLVSGDKNERDDVFVRDRQSGTTTLISKRPDGKSGNSHSLGPSISDDGRFVAFTSLATDLVVGDDNGETDIFVRDRLEGATERISTSAKGGEDWSSDPRISGDGRFVAFYSASSDLVPGDTNGWGDVFLYDRSTGKTQIVSLGYDGKPGNEESWLGGALSGDGRFLVFTSEASNLVRGDNNHKADVFLYDRGTGGSNAMVWLPLLLLE